MPIIKACLFDLDGVICNTAQFHFLAWKRLANELGFDISPEQNESLKSIGKIESLARILEWGKCKKTNEEKENLLTLKNQWYLEAVNAMTQDDVLPGVLALFQTLKMKTIKIGLGSASKNARHILDILQITDYFDVIIDGNMLENSKPDPEVFLKGAALLNVPPNECIVFEDSLEGIKAGQAAGCFTVGLGDMKSLKRANLVISSFEDISYDEMLECLY
jgi:beta-phosphoglucomutase